MRSSSKTVSPTRIPTRAARTKKILVRGYAISLQSQVSWPRNVAVRSVLQTRRTPSIQRRLMERGLKSVGPLVANPRQRCQPARQWCTPNSQRKWPAASGRYQRRRRGKVSIRHFKCVSSIYLILARQIPSTRNHEQQQQQQRRIRWRR